MATDAKQGCHVNKATDSVVFLLEERERESSAVWPPPRQSPGPGENLQLGGRRVPCRGVNVDYPPPLLTVDILPNSDTARRATWTTPSTIYRFGRLHYKMYTLDKTSSVVNCLKLEAGVEFLPRHLHTSLSTIRG